jgi:hypothetical protein
MDRATLLRWFAQTKRLWLFLVIILFTILTPETGNGIVLILAETIVRLVRAICLESLV